MRISQPHSLTILRPKSVKNVADNATSLAYSAPDFTRTIKCMVQAQDLTQMVEAEGLFYPQNINIWTYIQGFDSTHPFQPKDMFDLSGTKGIHGIVGKYICIMVTPQIDVRGRYSHLVMRGILDESR